MAYQLQIARDGKTVQVVPLPKGELKIGRSRQNDVALDDSMVSSRHAILNYDGKEVLLEDLGSTNGTYIEDTLLKRPIRLAPNRTVRIGGFTLVLQETLDEPNPQASPARDSKVVVPAPEAHAAKPDDNKSTKAFDMAAIRSGEGNARPQREASPHSAPPAPAEHPLTPDQMASLQVKHESPFNEAQQRKREMYRALRQEIQQELFNRLDLKRMVMAGSKDEELTAKARRAVDDVIESFSDRIPKNISKGQLSRDVYDEAIGLGPLEPFLADPDVTEVMVNGPDMIYCEKKGKLHLSESQFLDEQQLIGTIERIVAPIGRRIDESQPMVDARLKDGSRVNAIIPPLSLKGPCLTIRKFSKNPYQVVDLIKFGSMTAAMAEFFRVCVLLRKNILISGGTGSGKTTLLNVLSSYLPPTDRIVTIEDAAELRLNQHHVITLEARPPNIEGRGAVTIRDLVRNALRMRPDRIVVGECRGGETLDMLQAMNTGHDGSLTTVHANSPRDALSRVETLVLMAGMDLPMRAIREQVSSAINVIIHQDRFSDGTRKISSVTEIVGMENDIITMQELFKFEQTGLGPQAQVLGYFTATGGIPTFMEDIRVRGLSLDPRIFDKTEPPRS
jgi:pilus assembly protein CpaF